MPGLERLTQLELNPQHRKISVLGKPELEVRRKPVGLEIEAVLALGSLASDAWQKWRQTATGQSHSPPFQHVTHPTQPESSSGGNAER